MIADAVDTLITLGWALAGHDAVSFAAYLATTVAVAALLCGHQGQPWPLAGLLAWLRALRPREGVQTPACGPHSPSRLPRDLRGAPRGAQRRSGRSVPSWAHTEPYTYEEAA